MSRSEEERVRMGARDSIDLLRRKGWIQGAFSNHSGYCLVGAVDTVEYAETIKYRARKILARRRHRSAMDINLIDWNDSPMRRKDDVIELLGRVARGEGGDR